MTGTGKHAALEQHTMMHESDAFILQQLTVSRMSTPNVQQHKHLWTLMHCTPRQAIGSKATFV